MNNWQTVPATEAKVFVGIAVTLVFACGAAGQTQLWVDQFGSASWDEVSALTLDGAGGVLAAGSTRGSLGGPNVGGADVILIRYDGKGKQLWTAQFGSNSHDVVYGAAPDSAGGAMIGGSTHGNLGGPNAGEEDAWIARFDQTGNQLWVHQFGTSSRDFVRDLAPDGSGGIVVAGDTFGSLGGPSANYSDIFVARYDSAGSLEWIHQFGSGHSEYSTSVASDGAGGAFVGGRTGGDLVGTSLGFWDCVLARYDDVGNQIWLRQFGTGEKDRIEAMAPDGAGGVLIAGTTEGSFGGTMIGAVDAFIARYDRDGNQVWARQFGSTSYDYATAIAVDGKDGVFVAGHTQAGLSGDDDIFIARYYIDGNRHWIRQFGTIANDAAAGIVSIGKRDFVLVGSTEGSLGGPNAGSMDGYVARYTDGTCYANCDGSNHLDIFDFLCFQDSFVNGQAYACDCDTTTGIGVCDVFDFLCFQDAFASGCQ